MSQSWFVLEIQQDKQMLWPSWVHLMGQLTIKKDKLQWCVKKVISDKGKKTKLR